MPASLTEIKRQRRQWRIEVKEWIKLAEENNGLKMIEKGTLLYHLRKAVEEIERLRH